MKILKGSSTLSKGGAERAPAFLSFFYFLKVRSGWYVFAGTQNVRGKKHSRPDAAGQPRFKACLTPHPEKDVFYECSSFFNS